MPLTVMLVVLLAAGLHASWNFLVKRTDNKHVSMSAVVLGHLPFAAIAAIYAPIPPIEAWPYVVAGALLHTGYQLFLMNSYRFGDLSQVYPLARGVAPLLVATVSVLLLGVYLSRIELIAIAIIGSGIMSLTLVRKSDGLRNGRAAILALITGGFIAAYSLVDGLGAREAGTALGFYSWLSMLNALLFAGIMRVLRPKTIQHVVSKEWRLTVIGGGASFAAYALVIWAFTLAPIALVTTVRETSIVFALLLGVVVLKERLDLVKVLSTMLTMLGVGLLRLNR